ncbi:hypothetical protein M426DRAFT_257036 [Hypoxylon sp. CI-4A]|nr:hypothetical protein M426DRAFT_257036 [Hypoxylon sp. CI-4A]
MYYSQRKENKKYLTLRTTQDSRYHAVRNNSLPTRGKLPPTYPSLIPFIGSVAPFLWNSTAFFRRALFMGFDVYVYQDRDTIRRISRQSMISSPSTVYTYTLSKFFGMPAASLGTYRADDSGPQPKPRPGSNVPPQDRIYHHLHSGFSKAWSGAGLVPTTTRFFHAFRSNINEWNLSESWTEVDNFSQSFQTAVSSSLIQAVFGPTLLEIHPDFIENLGKFDEAIPWLAKGIPSFIIPGAHVRDTLRGQFKSWYVYARQAFDGSCIDADGDGDPFWGSESTRHRHRVLSQIGHDDDSLSAADLCLAWAITANAATCALMAILHIAKDPELLRRVREEIQGLVGDQAVDFPDQMGILKAPLLSSIYAETLRLYDKAFFLFGSQHSDIELGAWRLPKGGMGLLNSDVSHMDESFWNTKDGLHPLDTFWADRFLVDPADSPSGPIRPEIREQELGASTGEKEKPGKPVFSTKGCEGTWIPYGAGPGICPGRFVAKNVVLLTSALIINELDVELLTDRLEPNSVRYGIGLLKPKHSVPVRIRRRM